MMRLLVRKLQIKTDLLCLLTPRKLDWDRHLRQCKDLQYRRQQPPRALPGTSEPAGRLDRYRCHLGRLRSQTTSYQVCGGDAGVSSTKALGAIQRVCRKPLRGDLPRWVCRVWKNHHHAHSVPTRPRTRSPRCKLFLLVHLRG